MALTRTLIAIKQFLNRHAELGWNEVQTTTYIRKTIPLQPIVNGFGPLKTGALYKVGKGSRSILLRADIDALQTTRGVNHTCGHSTHTAALMQTLLDSITLEPLLTQSDKSVYFLFQPAEETYPSGAQTFIADCSDVVSSLSYAFAIHVRPKMKLNTIGLQSGPIWARGDYMELTITGKKVHVKNNEDGIDALEAASMLVLGVKKIQKKLRGTAKIHVGTITGGLQANTVADLALLKGDIRLRREGDQQKIKTELSLLTKLVEKKTGAHIKLDYFDGYPVLINDRSLTAKLHMYLKNNTSFSLQTQDLFSFGCEDFSFISHKVPSVVALIGTGDIHDLHEDSCLISDKGTETAYRYFSYVVAWWTQTSLAK